MKHAHLSIILVLLVSIFVVGCSQQNNPLSPQNQAPNTATLDKRGDDSENGNQDGGPVTDLLFVKFPIPNRPYNNTLEASVTVSPSQSGSAVVKTAHYELINGREVKVSSLQLKIQVPTGAVSRTTTLTIKIDTVNSTFGVTFGPHGTVFNKPIMLDVDASGLDLSGISSRDDIDLFYVSDGTWTETMQYRRIRFDARKGTLMATDVQIPHFSAYAFGRRK